MNSLFYWCFNINSIWFSTFKDFSLVEFDCDILSQFIDVTVSEKGQKFSQRVVIEMQERRNAGSFGRATTVVDAAFHMHSELWHCHSDSLNRERHSRRDIQRTFRQGIKLIKTGYRSVDMSILRKSSVVNVIIPISDVDWLIRITTECRL